jgi:hypothetical protein
MRKREEEITHKEQRKERKRELDEMREYKIRRKNGETEKGERKQPLSTLCTSG